MDWHKQFRAEIEQAENARAAGNEGKARVCARRAAGIVAERYLSNKGMRTAGLSAYEIIKDLNSYPDIPNTVRELSGHFILRVSKEFNLPSDIDLILDAQNLERLLLE